MPEFSSLGPLSEEEYEINKYYVKSQNEYYLASTAYSNYDENTEFFNKNIVYELATVN